MSEDKSKGAGVDVARLLALLEHHKLNPYAASRAAGLGGDYVRDLIRGRVKEPSARSLSAIATLLKTTPEYLLGLDDVAIEPAASLKEGWVRNSFHEQEQNESIAARIVEPGAQQDADLVKAIAKSISSAISMRLESHLKFLDTPASKHLADDIFSKTSRFASLNTLAEFARAFGLIRENYATALHNLETLRWNAESYPSPIHYETNRHFLIPFLAQILNPFEHGENTDEETLRADFVLASGIVLHAVAGHTELGDRLAHCHAGLATEAVITAEDLPDF